MGRAGWRSVGLGSIRIGRAVLTLVCPVMALPVGQDQRAVTKGMRALASASRAVAPVNRWMFMMLHLGE
jgi:hypothetical protein